MWCIRAGPTVPVQHESSTSQVPAPCQYTARTVTVQDHHSTKAVPVQYHSSTCPASYQSQPSASVDSGLVLGWYWIVTMMVLCWYWIGTGVDCTVLDSYCIGTAHWSCCVGTALVLHYGRAALVPNCNGTALLLYW